MAPAAIWAAGEQIESPWGVIGIAISTVGIIAVAWLSWRAKKNTEPNGGSSPHDAVMSEINALTRQMQIMDERSVVEQRNAHDVRKRLLDGQDRLAARQDEQAAMIDHLHVRIDTLAGHIEAAGAQADATVELVNQLNQTGG